MKKIISMCLVLAMFFSCLPIHIYAVESKNETATVCIDSATTFPGSTITINVTVENNPGILGATLALEYDSALTLINAESNGVLASLAMTSSIFAHNANFVWYGATIADKDIKDGTVLELTFEIAEDAPLGNQRVWVNSLKSSAFDKNKQTVTLAMTDGGIAVANYLPGDVDSNTNVNPLDLILLSQYIADGCEYREDGYAVSINEFAGDVDDSGMLNPLDLILISQYIADGCEYREDGYAVDLRPASPQCNHTMEKTNAVVATCEEDGNIAYWHCTKCDQYFSDENGNTKIALADTVVPATGHTIVIDEAVEPTTTTTGLTEGSHCSVCKKVLVAQEEIAILPTNTYSILYYLYDDDAFLAELGVNNPNPDTYTTKAGLALEEPTAEGYRFVGWSYGDNAQPVKNMVIPAGETGSKKLYAHWENDTYTVTFASDMIPQEPIEECTSDRAVQLPTLQMDKYTFVGWSDQNGNIMTEIPKGNTSDITVYANWSSNRNQAVPVKELQDPIICESPTDGLLLFSYEIGEIRNVPLYTTLELHCANGLISTTSTTDTKEISAENAQSVADTIATATTNSASWTLSNDWNETTEVSQKFLEETGMEREEAETLAKSQSDTYNMGMSLGGSNSAVSTNSGSFNLSKNRGHSNTTTTEIGQDFNLSVDAKYSSQTSASLALDNLTVGATKGFEIGGGVDYGNYRHDTQSGTTSSSTNIDIGREYSKTITAEKNWNADESYQHSQSLSKEESITNTISKLVSEEYGYGKNYALGGSNSEAQELASSNSAEHEYGSTLTYYNSEIETTQTSYSSTGATMGDYRMVQAGTVHVFAVVGYNIATSEYFVSTYNILDENTKEYLDYSYDGTFTDYETSIVPFEIPIFVNNYVNQRIATTEGFIIDTETGIIEGYRPTGDTPIKLVTIPSYVSIDNKDGTYTPVKVTGIRPNLFENRTEIVAVTLSAYMEDIPANAFAGCTSLAYIHCPAVTTIGENAFANCIALQDFYVPQTITSVGDNAFANVPSLSVTAGSKKVAQSITNSGAQNTVLDISQIPDDDNQDLSFDVGAIQTFELQGKGKTYSNLSLHSDADATILNGINVINGTGTTLSLSSSQVDLNQSSVSTSGYAMLLTADNTAITVYGKSELSSDSGNAVVSQNINLHSDTESSIYCKLTIPDKLLICGEIMDDDCLECDEIIQISQQEFEDYAKGMYSITLNSNGGTCSTSEVTAYYGNPIGTLPTPTRDYYTFEGWYTAPSGGSKITETYSVTEMDDFIIYAQWSENAISDWVLASQVPADAQEINHKWTYDQRTDTESKATSLSGYTQYDSYWEKVDSGSKNYATFPSGFDKSHSLYTSFGTEPYSAQESATSKRTVSNQKTGYVYWHWMYDVDGGNGTARRAINPYKGSGNDTNFWYDHFGAFTSTNGNYESDKEYCNSNNITNYIIPERTAYADCQGATRWFRFDYSTSSYTDYDKVFKYTKTESKESPTEVSTTTNITNVQQWVKYREI